MKKHLPFITANPQTGNEEVKKRKSSNDSESLDEKVNVKTKKQRISNSTLPSQNISSSSSSISSSSSSIAKLPTAVAATKKEDILSKKKPSQKNEMIGEIPLENSLGIIFGVDYLFECNLDQPLKILSHLIYNNIDETSTEIEGKIGSLVNFKTNERYYLPIQSETVLLSPRENGVEFKSHVTKEDFQHIKNILNGKVKEISFKYPEPLVKCALSREIDRIYEPDHIRVTIDKETRAPQTAIKKQRLGNLDFYCPHSRKYDFRVTISREEKVKLPDFTQSFATSEREKERVSYKFGNYWQIDVTRVISFNIKGKERFFVSETFEIELECNGKALFQEKELLIKGKKNQFSNIVRCLLNMIRTIIKLLDP